MDDCLSFPDDDGAVFDAVPPLLNVGARAPVCGLIAHYNDSALPPGPNRLPQLTSILLRKRVKMQGFIILDHYADVYPAFLKEMREWVAQGKVTLREDVAEGLEAAPQALIGRLDGKSLGKLVGPDAP
ncbi:hypothetical protein WS70_23980 [Burkholderia mayonis]|uniref:Uncharacterized protein n=1 Tax=Burkholderia mayonis TaxID=1385591 RepID=A0A1B4FMD3_9BURK|nr:hypothetical protein WS70_23980 [Burkholderia mayonis]KVE45636.1 hypothetical protein WS70_04355 [Burkholderia mayonis]